MNLIDRSYNQKTTNYSPNQTVRKQIATSVTRITTILKIKENNYDHLIWKFFLGILWEPAKADLRLASPFVKALIGPGGLRAPCMRHACAMHAPCVAWPLLLPTFALSFFLCLCLLLLTHFGESPVCENLFLPIFWHDYTTRIETQFMSH